MTRRSPRGALLTPGNGHRRAEPKETFQAVRSFTGCETPPHLKKGDISGLYLRAGKRRYTADAYKTGASYTEAPETRESIRRGACALRRQAEV